MKLKKAIITVLVAVLSLAMAAAFVGCDGAPAEAAVTAITLNMATAEVETGGNVKLVATATYADNTTAELKAGDVTWESDKKDVATVTRGIISGKSRGTAKITATYSGVSATCEVTVNAIEVVISGHTPNDDGKIELEVDDVLPLTAKVLKNGEELPNEKIVWSSSQPGLVAVNNGALTAINPGEATVTATREGTAQATSINVVVKEIENTEKMNTFEQNKTPANTWGYWGDQGYNWSNTTIHSAYTEEYEESTPDEGFKYIGAGKMNITFSVDKYSGSMAPGPHDASIQLFYRSSKSEKSSEGKLEQNHNYEIRFTIKSNTAGTIVVNPFDDVVGGYAMAEDNKAAHESTLEAGVEKVITVRFRHGDSGAIYASGKYDNVETAVNLLLGLLSAPKEGEENGNIVKVSVYNIMFKDLGESTNKWADDPTKLEGYVDPDAPTIPDLPTLILPAGDVTLTGATLTAEEGKAYLSLMGTINLEKFDDVAAAQQWVNDSYFDLQECGGSWIKVQFNRTATVNEDGTFVVKYDITRLTPDGTSDGSTGAYSAHFTEKEVNEDSSYKDNHFRDVKLDAEKAVHGTSVTVGTKKFTLVNYQGTEEFKPAEDNQWGQQWNYGCVAIKVENVEAEPAE